MKKTTQLLASAILLSTVSTGIVFAAGDGGVYESNGIVEFTPSTDPTKPVDPTDPTKPVTPVDPIDPTKPVTPGTNGPLSIDYASSLNFGKQSITSENKTYHASVQKYNTVADKPEEVKEKEGPNYVQITDNRGTEAGWTLKVNQDTQFKTLSGKELTGAVITFNNGNIVTNSASAKPTGPEKIVLNSNGEQANVMTAKADSGAGTYINAWGTNATDGAKSIELSVPGSTTKYAEKYTAKLVWTLTDVPGN